jgi:hypothetical protein
LPNAILGVPCPSDNALAVYNLQKRYRQHHCKSRKKIHIEQQKELLVVGFYLLYLFYWVRNLKQGTDDSYYAIPFEKEAYFNEVNLNYLKTRKRLGWRNT